MRIDDQPGGDFYRGGEMTMQDVMDAISFGYDPMMALFMYLSTIIDLKKMENPL